MRIYKEYEDEPKSDPWMGVALGCVFLFAMFLEGVVDWVLA